MRLGLKEIFRLILHISAVLSVTVFLVASGAQANSPTHAPDHFDQFQATLAESILSINCQNKSQLGIILDAGSAQKEVLTGSSLINSCLQPSNRNSQQSGITVSNFSKNQKIRSQVLKIGTGTAANFAWLAADQSFIFPRTAEDGRAPTVGEWLAVASVNTSGTSIMWDSSQVASLDQATFTFEASVPNSSQNYSSSLVFNSRGSLIGIVDGSQTVGSTTLHVIGSPARCSVANSQVHTSEICLSDKNAQLQASDLWKTELSLGVAAPSGKTRKSHFIASSDPFRVKSGHRIGRPTPSKSPEISITCKKGKTVKTVTGKSPTCPTGYSQV